MMLISIGRPRDHAAEHAYGVREVSIDTDMRLAMGRAKGRCVAIDRAEFDTRALCKDALRSAREICEARCEASSTTAPAARIKPAGVERLAEPCARNTAHSVTC